jgi:hypothetical protein
MVAPVGSTSRDKEVPLAGYANVRLIAAPRCVRHRQFWTATPFQFWRIALDPMPDCDVIHADVTPGRELLNISVAEPKPEIATDTKDEDRRFKLPSFEQRWSRPMAFQHPPRTPK